MQTCGAVVWNARICTRRIFVIGPMRFVRLLQPWCSSVCSCYAFQLAVCFGAACLVCACVLQGWLGAGCTGSHMTTRLRACAVLPDAAECLARRCTGIDFTGGVAPLQEFGIAGMCAMRGFGAGIQARARLDARQCTRLGRVQTACRAATLPGCTFIFKIVCGERVVVDAWCRPPQCRQLVCCCMCACACIAATAVHYVGNAVTRCSRLCAARVFHQLQRCQTQHWWHCCTDVH
jgi:hypothetical protein